MNVAAPLWTASDLLEATGGRFDTPFDAAGVSIDTRTLRPGDLFVALVGENGDGHVHAAAAIEAGAGGVMLHRDVAGVIPRVAGRRHARRPRAVGGFARARFGGG